MTGEGKSREVHEDESVAQEASRDSGSLDMTREAPKKTRRAKNTEYQGAYRKTDRGHTKGSEYHKKNETKGAKKYENRFQRYENKHGTKIQEQVTGINDKSASRTYGGSAGFVEAGEREDGGYEGVMYTDARGQQTPGYQSRESHTTDLLLADRRTPAAQRRYDQMWDENNASPETSSPDSYSGY